MVPDFRFVLGAFLAVAVLLVTGVGLVASARLVHEAHRASVEESRSLAYAGHPEWNQFYDPDRARRAAVPAPAAAGETAPPEKREEARAEPLAPPANAPARSTTMPLAETTEEKPLDPALLDPRPTAGAPELVTASLPSGGAEAQDSPKGSEAKPGDA